MLNDTVSITKVEEVLIKAIDPITEIQNKAINEIDIKLLQIEPETENEVLNVKEIGADLVHHPEEHQNITMREVLVEVSAIMKRIKSRQDTAKAGVTLNRIIVVKCDSVKDKIEEVSQREESRSEIDRRR